MKREGGLFLRSVAFPVARPHGSSWKDLDAALRRAWSMSTNLANWAMLELFRHDVVRSGGMDRLPPLPPDKKGGLYLYGAFTGSYHDRGLWDGCTQSAQCVLRAVRARYGRARFGVIWRAEAYRAHYRYPYPFPVHNAAWRPSWSEEGQHAPQVCLNLPGGTFTLRLRSDNRHAAGGFREIMAGARRGEAAVCRRKNGAVMLKLVAWRKPRERGGREAEMRVRTDPEHFWVVEIDGQGPRFWEADHVVRLHMAHKVWLQRVAEDTKYEKRVPGKMRQHIGREMSRRAAKHYNRLHTWSHEATRQLIQLAQRQRVARIVYDDACDGYFRGRLPAALLTAQDMSGRPLFPMRSITLEQLRYKAEEAGIELVHRPAGGEAVKPGDGGNSGPSGLGPGS